MKTLTGWNENPVAKPHWDLALVSCRAARQPAAWRRKRSSTCRQSFLFPTQWIAKNCPPKRYQDSNFPALSRNPEDQSDLRSSGLSSKHMLYVDITACGQH